MLEDTFETLFLNALNLLVLELCIGNSFFLITGVKALSYIISSKGLPLTIRLFYPIKGDKMLFLTVFNLKLSPVMIVLGENYTTVLNLGLENY